MLNSKVGDTIRALRLERRMTQKQLADKLNISDKTVSKWERGLGLPDVSLIAQLCDLLEADTQKLLKGDISPNDFVGGNMKNTTYFVCPVCQNICLCTGHAQISCCGKKLTAQTAKKPDDAHKLTVETVEDDWYITGAHPMTKQHYISFVVFATGGRLEVIKQYPEWNLALRLPKRGHGMLIWYCVNHGLFSQPL